MSFAAVIARLQKLENPYPGLRPFETAESHVFFGRDEQVAEVLSRLERNHFLAVLGVSGSGKSSLVRAGLIPALGRGSVANPGRRWRIVVTRPAGAPFERLARALDEKGLNPSGLSESSFGLAHVARQFASDERLLVIIDQFEELFRYKELAPATQSARRDVGASAAAAAAEFVQLLLAAGQRHPPVYIVLTIRSDYLGDCAEFSDLPETLNDCQYLLPRLTREQRKEAIEGPLGSVEIAPTLVQRMLNDAGDEPDQLPVLQHALMRTWAHWRRTDPHRTRRIELLDYESIGGFDRALNEHANELLDGVSPNVAANIFKRLTARGRGQRERRDPATLRELWALCGADTPERQQQVTDVVDRFRHGEATFLSPREGAIGEYTYVDITHESLIRHWATLREEWLPQEERLAKQLLDLADRARLWSRQKAELLMGADLAAAVEWNEQRNPSAAWAEHYVDRSAFDLVLEFIHASVQHARQAAARQARERRRFRLAVTVAVLAILAGLVAISVYQYRATQAARKAAAQARILAARSVQDPAVRALLLSVLGDDATDDHMAIYHEAATALVPFAIRSRATAGDAKALGFREDGRVAVAFTDGTVSSWRRDGRGNASDRVVADLPDRARSARSEPWITAAAFSRDGRWVAIGLCTAEVWVHRLDASTGSRYAPRTDACPTSGAPVTALTFSHDGRLLAAGYKEAPTRVWTLDGSEGPPRGKAETFGADEVAGVTITSVDFDRAARLATGDNRGVFRVWGREGAKVHDFSLGERRPAGDKGKYVDPVTRVVFSADAGALLSAHRSGAVVVWQLGQAAPVPMILGGHTGAVTDVAFSRDGGRIGTASEDGTARVWTVESERRDATHQATIKLSDKQRILPHDARVTAAAFDPDGRTVVTITDDGSVRTWPIEPGEPQMLGVHDLQVESVAVSPDDLRVASGSDDQTARIWPLDQAPAVSPLGNHLEWVRSVAFNPADPQQLLTGSVGGTVRFWEWSTGKVRLAAEHGTLYSASFDSIGTRVVTAMADGTARVWKLAMLKEGRHRVGTLKSPDLIELQHKARDDKGATPPMVLSASFSRDGSKIVTGSYDGMVRIWTARTGALEREFRDRNRRPAFSVAFSPDGSRIAAAMADGAARIWQVHHGSDEPLFELRHSTSVKKVAFSADGRKVLTGSMDGTARVWSAQSGLVQLTLAHGDELVTAVAFDSKATRAVTGTNRGAVRLWRLAVPALRHYLSEATTTCLTPAQRERYLGEKASLASLSYEHCEARYERSAAVKHAR